MLNLLAMQDLPVELCYACVELSLLYLPSLLCMLGLLSLLCLLSVPCVLRLLTLPSLLGLQVCGSIQQATQQCAKQRPPLQSKLLLLGQHHTVVQTHAGNAVQHAPDLQDSAGLTCSLCIQAYWQTLFSDIGPHNML